MSLRYNINLPPEFKNRKSISAAELRAIQAGEYDNKKMKVPAKPKLRSNHQKDFAKYENGILIITIHELPTSQNQRKNWHWTTTRDEKARWEEIIWGLVMEVGKPAFIQPVVKVNFYFPNNIRRDPADNYMSWKALTDGLTNTEVIKDDSWQITKVLAPGADIDRDNPRTEILVWEEKSG